MTLATAPANLLVNRPTANAPSDPGAQIKYAANNQTPAETNDPGGGEQLTLQGLMQAWGTSDSRYDLTRDGTVDVQDLLAFVAKEQGDPDALTQDGFAKAWGTDDPRYDLTQDGTVDVKDLLAFLEGVDPATRVALDPALAASANATTDAGGGAITIAGLLAAWGSNDRHDDAPYDITDDGRVDVSDLLSVLASDSSRETEPAPARPTPSAVEASERVATVTRSDNGRPAVIDGGAADDIEGVQKMWGSDDARYDYDDSGVVDVEDLLSAIAARADRDTRSPSLTPIQAATTTSVAPDPRPAPVVNILNRLAEAGFTQQPPVNLHELLNAAGLDGKERDDVLQGVQQQYPNGLGVNFHA